MPVLFKILLNICFYAAISTANRSTDACENISKAGINHTTQPESLFLDIVESESEEKEDSADQESGKAFFTKYQPQNNFKITFEDKYCKKTVLAALKIVQERCILFCSLLE